ncbi:hypothetical protein ACOME3_003043 [Neoechinorhynchus agilis]
MSQSDNELVSSNKLRDVAKRLGVDINETEALELINVVDEDENGEIGLQEFQQLMCSPVTAEELRKEIQDTFNVFDKDGNGTITCKELGTLIREFDGNLNDAETKEMVRVADINQSGTIEIDEFIKLLTDDKEQ